jgi:hypothetical protein
VPEPQFIAHTRRAQELFDEGLQRFRGAIGELRRGALEAPSPEHADDHDIAGELNGMADGAEDFVRDIAEGRGELDDVVERYVEAYGEEPEGAERAA